MHVSSPPTLYKPLVDFDVLPPVTRILLEGRLDFEGKRREGLKWGYWVENDGLERLLYGDNGREY